MQQEGVFHGETDSRQGSLPQELLQVLRMPKDFEVRESQMYWLIKPTLDTHTVNWKIFVLKIFRKEKFRVKKFS